MVQARSDHDVIVQFWEWYEHRHGPARKPIANLALDKCEEAMLGRDWRAFAYWHSVFVRERPPQNR